MPAVSLSGVYSAQFFTDAGDLAANYRLYTYSPGTTTKKVAYTEQTGTTSHSYVSDGAGGEYIALNARGELPAPLFMADGGYDLCLKTPAGATVWTRRAIGTDDAATQVNADLLSAFSASSGSSLVGYLSAGFGASATTVQAKLRQAVSVKDFGAVGDGVNDDTAEIQAALNELDDYSELTFPPGTYLISSKLTLASQNHVSLRGYGARIYENGATLAAHFEFTSCDWLTVAGFDFEATEDFSYFTSNTPSENRACMYFVTCDNTTVRDVSGRGKRRFMTTQLCNYFNLDGFRFTGFGQDVSLGAQASMNFCSAAFIRGATYTTISNGRVDHHGSAVVGELDNQNVAVRNITAHDLHDNAVYFPSGTDISVSGVSTNDTIASGVKLRAINGSVTNCSINASRDFGVMLTGYGTSTDAFGATGNTLTAVGNAIRGSKGGIRANVGDSTYYPRDLVIVGNAIENCTGTGTDGMPIEVITDVGGAVVSGNSVRTFACDIGINVTGVDASNRATYVNVSNNVVTDGNGSASADYAAIRLSYVDEFACVGNVISDIASGIGILVLGCTEGSITANVYNGGQTVRIPSAESNSGIIVSDNRGSSINVPEVNCIVGLNYGVVTGWASTATTPKQQGNITISGADAYIAVATSSSADWKKITP